MFTAGFDFVALIPFAVFGAIAAAAWWLLGTLAGGSSRAEQRLDEFKDPSIRRRREEEGAPIKEAGTMAKMLEKASPTLAKPLQPRSEAAASKLKQRLTHAGFRSETAPTIFLGLKFSGLLIGILLGGGTLLTTGEYTYRGLLRAAITAACCFYLPDVLVWFLGRRRKEAIFLGLPDTLDLLVVCVEAGLALDQAMRKVAEEMKKSYRIIADEFALCNFQLQMGRTRNEVLHELGQRTGVADLQSLASILIQADKFGTSVAQALRVQSDSMRTRRSQMAEEKAAKTAVKLIFPLVLFIFPGIFVVLIGPAAITVVRQMLPVMGGAK